MNKTIRNTLSAVVLAATSLSSLPAMANQTGWSPSISEKILMLPSEHLETAIEQDFDRSPLANELGGLENDISLQINFLSQIQNDLDLYEGEQRLEARHQLIAGKRDYIEMMGTQIDLKKKRLAVKLDIYERLMRKARQGAAANSQSASFDAARSAVVNRINSVDSTLREDLFTNTMMPETEFSKAYADNQAAISQLVEAINTHPSQQTISTIDGNPISREEELRLTILDIQSQMAILDMEDEVLGHMAKLVALDAKAFSVDLAEYQYGVDGYAPAIYNSPANNLHIFINR